MKRLYLILPLLLLSLPCTTNAENRATRLLDKIVAPIESGKGISLKFLLQQSDMENVEGSIDMLSDKFVLQVPDMITWFDGTTQWTYLKSSEEVNISIPEKDELLQTNPCLLLQSYKKAFDCKFIEKKGDVCELSLIPKQHSEITEIEIFVDEKQTALTHIAVIQKDGQKTDVDIIRYETNTNFPANHFVFQKGMYPHAEIIDLR